MAQQRTAVDLSIHELMDELNNKLQCLQILREEASRTRMNIANIGFHSIETLIAMRTAHNHSQYDIVKLLTGKSIAQVQDDLLKNGTLPPYMELVDMMLFPSHIEMPTIETSTNRLAIEQQK